MKSYNILIYPLVSEKSINLIDFENKIVFVVNNNADKASVKEAVEKRYGVKVDKVNIVNDMKGRKKAFVKLSKEHKASELASKIGLV